MTIGVVYSFEDCSLTIQTFEHHYPDTMDLVHLKIIMAYTADQLVDATGWHFISASAWNQANDEVICVRNPN